MYGSGNTLFATNAAKTVVGTDAGYQSVGLYPVVDIESPPGAALAELWIRHDVSGWRVCAIAAPELTIIINDNGRNRE
jgi:hypothetical protein